MNLRRMREGWRELDEVTDLGPVVRRYFVIGAFDGALTVLGIVIGAVATVGGRPEASGLVVALGAYLGSLIRERIVITGLRFVATGLGTAALLWALGTAGVRFLP